MLIYRESILIPVGIKSRSEPTNLIFYKPVKIGEMLCTISWLIFAIAVSDFFWNQIENALCCQVKVFLYLMGHRSISSAITETFWQHHLTNDPFCMQALSCKLNFRDRQGSSINVVSLETLLNSFSQHVFEQTIKQNAGYNGYSLFILVMCIPSSMLQ